ncbi:C-type lectin domain family 2 member B [Dasypus novemcinctus]|uniref:C-type lectin domain family 2 member B n=1 Tax=Dasypus novemcinctus TaxID=9361 RepID=UPI0003287F14|nr:C-type lectin domain family 2 member B [Dasypus novemcinctus]
MTQNIQKPACTKEAPATDDRNQGSDAKKKGFRDKLKKCSIMAVFIVVAIIIYFVVQSCVKTSLPCKCSQRFCPDDWIGFYNNCYYFSEEERDWNSSRDSCISEHADLTIMDTMKERDFLMRHKGSSDHWIGLKLTGIQIGKWVNGATFSKWFNVSGNEECAYLSDGGVASARCYAERKWICRKNAHHLE